MENILDLVSIKDGLPGIHKDSCAHYYSACMTTLHRSGHKDGVVMQLDGDRKENISLHWDDYYDESIDRTWKEINYCTDHAAVCVSCMLAINETEYTIIERSCKGDGLFGHAARLEISGILQESTTNTVEKRLKIKIKQTEQSDESRLPAYISIVEFGKPKAIFKKK